MTEIAGDILITGGRVLLPGADPHQPPTCDIRIRDGRITAIDVAGSGPVAGPGPGPRTVDASGLLVLPGFVNAQIKTKPDRSSIDWSFLEAAIAENRDIYSKLKYKSA